MERVLSSTTENKEWKIQLTSTHGPELTEEDFDLDEAKTARPHIQRGHAVSYPLASEKVNDEDEDDDDKEFRSHLREFVPSYRHVNVTGLSEEVYTTALYVDDSDNVRFFDVMGEIASRNQLTSHLPKNVEDIRKGPKCKWNAEAVSKEKVEDSDVIYKLPYHRVLVSTQYFASQVDLLKSFRDAIEAQKFLWESGEVHGNVDLNTMLTDEHRPGDKRGSHRGYLFDYEPARSFAIPGFENVNWRLLLSSVPQMREYIPDLIKKTKGMKFADDEPEEKKT